MPINEKQDIIDFLMNTGKIIGPPLGVGLIGKLSYEISKGRKMPWYKWMAITGMSIAAAIGAHWVCKMSGTEGVKETVIISLTTMFAEKIFLMLFSLNLGIIFKEVALSAIDKAQSILKGKK